MKKVISAKAVGHSILVEMLTEAEASGSALVFSDNPSKQAFVRDIGPNILHAEKPCGLSVGDRVLLQGSYVPLPTKGENGRSLGVVDLHNIKAILVEEEE